MDKNNYMELLISSNAYNCIPFDSTVGKRYFYKVDIPKVKLIDIWISEFIKGKYNMWQGKTKYRIRNSNIYIKVSFFLYLIVYW